MLAALYAGYRMIDTAYIYSNEKTEAEVGEALSQAMAEGVVERADVFVTTKHWRKYHGFEPALGCLQRSLERLQLGFVDCWMMHWPGPAWEKEFRSRPGRRCSKARGGAPSEDQQPAQHDEPAAHGPWHYAADGGPAAALTLALTLTLTLTLSLTTDPSPNPNPHNPNPNQGTAGRR